VDPETFTMDAAKLERALTARTRVVLPVHLYGHPADMERIVEVAARHGLPVLEDAAQAHGAEIGGRRAGALGHAACFSFYPSKNLGAYGDAGMVVSDDAAFVARVRQIASHGAGTHRYDHVLLGTNSRLDALQAAVLRVKLRHLDAWNAERGRRARLYAQAFAGTNVRTPVEPTDATHVHHLYVVGVAHRASMERALKARGVATAVYYPRALHATKLFHGSIAGRTFPVSDALSEDLLAIPLYPEMSDEQQDTVVSAMRAAALAHT
jgi:dTDP-4-amino-4,6-dideoxygalactose transaminase